MQIELIQTFLDLSETRSFNRTAERLSVTQSTVSGRINALERAVGHRLFSRSRAGTELTTAGLRFAPHARALLHAWTEARHAVGDSGGVLSMRIGIQSDLVTMHFNELIGDFRAALPGTAFLFEADYSAQMCRDVQGGTLDLALLFTPHPSPDIHFESLGELTYRMVAPVGQGLDRLAEVTAERYVLANLSPAFSRTHDALLPALALPALAAGQGATVRGMILSLGVAGYQEEKSAQRLIAAGQAVAVAGAPPLTQPIFAAIHYRNRHRAVWRKLMTAMRENLPGGV